MGIEVQGKTIETDTNGYLVNQRDWSQEVAMKLAAAEKIDMTETHWGLIEAVRQFSDENKQQVSMIDLIHLLSKHLKETRMRRGETSTISCINCSQMAPISN